MDDRYVRCPLVDEDVEDIDCIENRDIVDEMLAETCMPEKYKQKQNWKEICRECKWHNY